MRVRATLVLGSLLLAAAASSCFPELPDETLVDNLRVLAVQADPATANFTSFPPPVITVTVLVVDPGDDDLSEATHTWSLDLPEDADASELDSLIPEPPHGTKLVVDLFGRAARDEEPEDFGLVEGVLPLRYRVETPDDHRDAVKLVAFLLPDLGDDDDSADETGGSFIPVATFDDDDDFGDDDDLGDDDSADQDWGGFPGDEDDEVTGDDAPEQGLDLLINDNPQIVSIQVDDGPTFSAESEELPGLEAPLFIGQVVEAGATLTVVVSDDEDEEDLEVELYRTTGCPNLQPEDDDPFGGLGAGSPFSGGGAGQDQDPCGEDDGFGDGFGGFRSDDDVDWTLREFAWRPLPGESSEGARLFVVLRDSRGGQSWQEVRAETAPE